MKVGDNIWGIVLAGGEGKRLQDFIRQRYGAERPKQYSAIIGNRTMLRHTLDRVEKIIPTKQIKIVVNRTHEMFLKENISEREKKSVIITPKNRESAASIYFALSRVYLQDPESISVIFPSDHFIGEETRFLGYVEQAISFVKKYSSYIVLLGIKPTETNTHYGWIEPSKGFLVHEGSRFHKVISFCEKPNQDIALRYFRSGGLWNSLVLVAKSQTMVKVYKKHLQPIYDAFKRAKLFYGTDEEDEFINNVFNNIPSMSFSKSILEEISESLYVLKAEGIFWSDWGCKEQVTKDLDALGALG